MTLPKTVSDALAASLARIAQGVAPANEVHRRESRVRHRALLAQAQRRGVAVTGPIAEVVLREALTGTEAFEKLGEALAEGRTLIVLSGASGCGKSVCLSHQVLRSERPALLVHAATLGEALAHASDRDRRELGQRALESPLLGIDDMGTEVLSEASLALVALICQRVDRGGMTLVSTNLDEEAFRARYFDGAHGRVASRFAATGAFCRLRDVDFRREPARLADLDRR